MRRTVAGLLGVGIVAASVVAWQASRGAGEISAQCESPTIVGTSGDDKLVGTSGPDVIDGLGGDDKIGGLGGDDVICGGTGRDVLNGGGGDDQLYGGLPGGSDDPERTEGEGGPFGDRLAGGPGDDLIDPGGEPGSSAYAEDTVTYAAASQGVRVDLGAGTATGEGTDTIVGQVWRLMGSSHDDRLRGSGRDDVFRGGGGRDLIDVDGSDRAGGGDGDDAITLVGPVGPPGQTLDGGPGAGDSLSLSFDGVVDPTTGRGVGQSTRGLTNLPLGTTVLEIPGHRIELVTSRFEDVELGICASWTVIGTSGPNRLEARGNGNCDVDLRGGAGDDVLIGGHGDDVLRGGPGSDEGGGYEGSNQLVSIESRPCKYSPDCLEWQR